MENASQAILTVSLKEYKDQINALRAELLSLENTSQEYKDTADKVREMQHKLNEVMNVGKASAEGVEGSYNQLSQRMSELKKQWKTLEIGTEEWRNMAIEIDNINNQLKDADAQVGVFTRNVGDYENAFGQAFETAMDQLNNFSPALGQMGGQIKKVIPLIKTINSTATKGLSGIKKALVSTGIGAIVVAVGLLLAYWKDIVALFDKSDVSAAKTKASVEKMAQDAKDFKDSMAGANAELTRQEKLLEARGQTRDISLQNRIDSLKDWQTEAERNAKTSQSLYETAKWFLDGAGKSFRKNNGEIEKAHRGIAGYQRLAAAGITNITEETVAELKKQAEESADVLSIISGKIADAQTDLDVWREEQKKKEQEAAAAAAKSAKDAADAKIKADKDAADTIAKRAEDSLKTELQLLDEQYAREKAQLEAQGIDIANLTQEWENKRAAIIKKNEEEAQKLIEETHKKAIEDAQNKLTKSLGSLDKEANQERFLLNFDEGTEISKADRLFEIQKNLIEGKIALLEEFKTANQLSAEEEMEIAEQVSDLKQQLDNADLEHKKAVNDAEKQLVKDKIGYYTQFSDSIASIMGSVGDIWENYINQRVEQGKMSEEEGKKEFERMKGLQIAVATIQTISGAIMAFMTAQELGFPWGTIIGAVQAAAVTAAGIAQIAQIKSTTLGGSSSAGNSMPATVTPVPDTYKPQEVNNVTGASEVTNLQNALENTNLYVKVSDINSAQERVKVRDTESSF